ncbi:MAG TPA: zf-TFIIB domain-containing protein [Phycisphaerae bacterium]|nr:zf-TFIIB domain-containing protein [Phycisphaerae bacterium]
MSLKCPKCQAAMEEVTIGTVIVDRCTACRGIWFDAKELEELEKVKGSERMDIGEVGMGHRMDAVTDVKCPRCGVPLKTVADVDQHHISYEICTKCGGSFFDAGEFTDLKSYTFMDYLRGLMKHRKKG